MGKKKIAQKAKRFELRKGSRLKLKNGKYARCEGNPKFNDMTILVKVYEDKGDDVRNIPLGQISELVRY